MGSNMCVVLSAKGGLLIHRAMKYRLAVHRFCNTYDHACAFLKIQRDVG